MNTPLSGKALSFSLFSLSLASSSFAATLGTSDLGSVSGLDIQHGTQLSSTYSRAQTWDLMGIRFSTTTGIGISAYDTEFSGGADPDLERTSDTPAGPSGNNTEWAEGNISLLTQIGIIAVIQEDGASSLTNNDPTGESFYDTANDEGTGGIIRIELKPELGMVAFDVVALDADNEAGDSYEVTLTGNNGGTYTVDLVANAAAQGLSPEYGDRSINNLGTVDINKLSGGADTVIVQVDYEIIGDSGGTGGFTFTTVPEPSTALISLLGLGMAIRRRR